ncbi:hypothetical protein [Streptomyces sp. NPDC002889]|uniref:hypothetical protein n=1 Tax=Streptomyces sp. NPDC002889 TaxID=3364669 RepID=UPI003687F100
MYTDSGLTGIRVHDSPFCFSPGEEWVVCGGALELQRPASSCFVYAGVIPADQTASLARVSWWRRTGRGGRVGGVKTPRLVAVVALAVAGVPSVALLVADAVGPSGATPVQAPGAPLPARVPAGEASPQALPPPA